jgi:hypothetical protein
MQSCAGIKPTARCGQAILKKFEKKFPNFQAHRYHTVFGQYAPLRALTESPPATRAYSEWADGLRSRSLLRRIFIGEYHANNEINHSHTLIK